jgi:hypothetical protein
MDILLEWNASSDNVGVRGYELEVTSSSGVKVYKLSNVTSYLLRNLVDSENFEARLRAFDFAGNYSAWTAPLNFSTLVLVVDSGNPVVELGETVIEE